MMNRLDGVRVIVTRAVHQAEELAAPLRALGADVILLPVIAIAAPEKPERLREAALRANEYDWIIFTSANAVAAFAAEPRDGQSALRARVATVGEGTRKVAEAHGFEVAVTPRTHVAESLIEALDAENLNQSRILIPRAAVARDIVPDELRKRGAAVDVVDAYRNVVPAEAAEKARAIFGDSYDGWVSFASSSAVHNLVNLVGVDRLHGTKTISIGPITSATIRKYALRVSAEAEVHTVQGLIDTLCQAVSVP